LTWSATAGQMYQMQCSTNLSRTNWTDWGSAILATNAQTSVKPVFWLRDDRNLKARFFAQMKPQLTARSIGHGGLGCVNFGQ
jgi:hypothetical protein